MLFQFPEFLSYIFIYLPPIIYTCCYIAMLVFGYLIRKKNGYTYGLYFMISAILSLTSNILFFVLNLPFLPITLIITLNLPFSIVSIIMALVNLLFLILGVTSSVFLVIALYSVYQNHKTPRFEPNTT